MSLFYCGSTNFLRQKRSANCEIRSVFCFYTLPSSSASNRNSDSNRSLSDSNRNLSDSNRNLSDSNRNAVLPLLAAHCFPCLHPTASLSSQKFFRLKTFHAFLLRFQYKNVLLHEKGPADVPRKNVVGP